jgi:hypothetical protein
MPAKIDKLRRALIGLWLMARYHKTFDASVLKGRRVAIVGAADSAFGTGRGAYIDGFDFVVRINKAPYQLKDGRFAADIGTRTDILFHSFFENEFSGGGRLDFELYDQLGIRYVINPVSSAAGRRVTFNFYKSHLSEQVTFSLPKHTYRQIAGQFGEFRPTIGFCSLWTLLYSGCAELFITGFTFFKTRYGDGYRDALKDVETNRKYIAESKIHNPDMEYDLFKKHLVLSGMQQAVFADEQLVSILRDDGVVISPQDRT